MGPRLGLLIVCACQPSDEPARRLLFDFESDEGWTVERGDVWAAPSTRRSQVHRHGEAFLGTAETEEGKRDVALRGVLRSPEFVVDHDYLVLRAGGGSDKGCFVSLRTADDEKDIHKITPKEGRMLTFIWDARDYEGESLVLRLVDRPRETDCSVHIDYVRLVDE